MNAILDFITDIIMLIVLVALLYGIWNMIQATKFLNLTTSERAVMYVAEHDKYVSMEKSYEFVESIKNLIELD